MPAYIPSIKAMGIKWISGYPDNPKKGWPQIAGLIILNDTETGLPLAIMDGIWITAQRTAAATAVSAKYLARSDSETVGILGAGVQGFSNLNALKVLSPIKKVVVYDIVAGQLEKYEEKITETWPDLEVLKVKQPKQAVQGLDIVVTAGPIRLKPHATIKAGWLSEGSFASLVDFDSYWTGEALHEADKFTTDDVPQLEYYHSIGYFQDIPPVYADLGELVNGKKKGRKNEYEKTIACNLGVAIEDIASATLIYQRAKMKDIGIKLPR
jgi:ornithine cyclodeaminase/alanine dehydrogenase